MTDLRSRASEAPATGRRAIARRTVVIAVAGVAVLAVVVAWAVVFSPLFAARDVQVHGVTGALAMQVERTAAIDHGTPLVRLDAAAVTRRVEKIPEVASAQVSTSFPSTVSITVTGRTAVGYVRRGDGGALVDRDGVQYRTVTKVPKQLPRFVLPTGAAARPTARALGVVAAALSADLRSVVTSLQALDTRSITLTVDGSDGDVLVRWGSSAESGLKARVLPRLLKRSPTLIDLTDAHRPFIR